LYNAKSLQDFFSEEEIMKKEKTWGETFFSSVINFVVCLLVMLVGYSTIIKLGGNPSLAVGISAGGFGAVACLKGWWITRHQYSQSVVAEVALILGAVCGSAIATVGDFDTHGLLRIIGYELIAFYLLFVGGWAVNILTALGVWRGDIMGDNGHGNRN